MVEERTYDPAVFLRKSKKGQHLIGFMPEKVEPDMVLIISIEELRKLVRGGVEYVRSSLLPPTPQEKVKPEVDEL